MGDSAIFEIEQLRYFYDLKKEVVLERLAEIKRKLSLIDEYNHLLEKEG